MTVKEVIGALGSWSVRLSEGVPSQIRSKIDFFGHVAIFRGEVSPDAHSNTDLLRNARYVGVIREIDLDETRELGGAGMVVWLGDEDEKGDVFETKVTLTAASLATAVAAVLPDATTVGTVYAQPTPGQTITTSFQFVTPRTALQTICDHFGVEYRVNGDASVDVGTQADLYESNPDSIIVRRGAGTDMGTVAIGARFGVKRAADDYTTRALLVGQTQDDATFAIGAADAPSVPYLDLLGNPVKRTRMISESGTPSGSVASRAQLQINRYARTKTSLRVTADEYETRGNFRAGDLTDVYDPDSGIYNASREVYFRGSVLHPDLIRITEIGWGITEGHSVLLRTQAGEWLDLTPYVEWETGSNEIVVGDLPRTLTRPTSNPVIDRADALPDASIPEPPTGLTLATTSSVTPTGENTAVVIAEWTAPTQNTDGTPLLDLDHYEVRHRPAFRAPLWSSTSVAGTEVDLSAVVDLVYDVAVRAVDKAGNRSAWTATVSITASKDTTAPAAPSDPVVTSYLGQLRIEWNGLDSTGQPMPPDFNRVDVHVSSVSGFTPGTSTLVASLSTKGVAYATAPYGATRYVRFLAYDHNQNVSAASGQTSGATTQVADGDVASLSVGKLTAGIMTADVTISGRFGTALTGARREMNSVGFQAWDSSNNLLINLDGVNNLLTGRFRTALTGRRMDLGAAGATGTIYFYAPDNTQTKIQAWTSPFGNEAIQVSAPIASTYGGWNSLQIESEEEAFLYSGFVAIGAGGNGPGTKGFILRWMSDRGTVSTAPSSTTRMYVTENNFTQWYREAGSYQIKGINAVGEDLAQYVITDGLQTWYPTLITLDGVSNAGPRMEMIDRSSVNTSPRLKFQTAAHNGFRYGGLFKFWIDIAGGTLGNFRMEVRDSGDTQYIPVYASAFTVASDRSLKEDIRDLDRTGASAKIRDMRLRRWREKPIDEARPAERIGLVAQEAQAIAPEIITEGGDTLGVDVMSLITLLIADSQEKDARIVALEQRGIARP